MSGWIAEENADVLKWDGVLKAKSFKGEDIEVSGTTTLLGTLNGNYARFNYDVNGAPQLLMFEDTNDLTFTFAPNLDLNMALISSSSKKVGMYLTSADVIFSYTEDTAGGVIYLCSFGAGSGELQTLRFSGNSTDGVVFSTASEIGDTPVDNVKMVDGDVEVLDSSKGIILKSPDDTRWRLQVSNAGALTITSL